MKWEFNPGKPGIQAPLLYTDKEYYVISYRPSNYTLSFRPQGKHNHLGKFLTLEAAIVKAEDYNEQC